MDSKCSQLINLFINLLSKKEQFSNSIKSVNKNNIKELKNKVLEIKKIKECIDEFFIESIADDKGRIIPGKKDKRGKNIEKLKSLISTPDVDFTIDKIDINKINYKEKLDRLEGSLNIKIGITPEIFKSKTEQLVKEIESRNDLIKLLNGPVFPLVIPKITEEELGIIVANYLEGVRISYEKQFNDRDCSCYTNDIIKNKNHILPSTRYEKLFERLKQGPTVLLYLANTMQMYSINASIEQESTLPESLYLSGIESIIAMITYPEVFGKDHKTLSQVIPTIFVRDENLEERSIGLLNSVNALSCGSSLNNNNDSPHPLVSVGLSFIR